MPLAPGFNAWTRLWSSLTRRRMEVEEELSAHLEMLESEFLREGLSPEMARLQALQKFGNPNRIREAAIRARSAQRRRKKRDAFMDNLPQDLRYALRGLLKARGFTAVVLLTLTLGIGATVAMYSVLHAALGEALPFPEPERLVAANTTIRDNTNLTSFPDFMDIRDGNESFESFGAILGFTLPVTVTGT